MVYKTVYVSANCNRVPTALDFSKNDLVAYAACHAVLIYDLKLGITHTLLGHSGRVNSIRFLQPNNSEVSLISGGSDGRLIYWSLKNNEYLPTHIVDSECQLKLRINVVDGCIFKEEIFVCSITTSLKVWKSDSEGNFKLQETLQFGKESNPKLCISLRIYPHQSELFLAVALDDSTIKVFKYNNEKFELQHTLCGHEDWVQGLDFAHKGDSLRLASASQDNFIRIWRITDDSAIEESVLYGHENWVYSVHWNPTGTELLSASMDKSLIVWKFDEQLNLWLESCRLGEVGGNNLGFFGARFNANASKIIGYSYQGAMHAWSRLSTNMWEPQPTLGGHFGEVSDLAWALNGEFLYTTSTDQTTRIHAPWKSEFWHEIARPQIHGYDLNTVAVFGDFSFVTGAEEKVIRRFEAPETFFISFINLCHPGHADKYLNAENMPKGASVPSLGLSNKAVYVVDNIDDTAPIDAKNPYPEESHFTCQILTEPPTEETLLQNTLWPETQKLYGHGYEVFALASSPDGKFLASACKSTKPQHSAIFIWDTKIWEIIQQLHSHTLTVVQMSFSPDGRYLLSVSRDRRWTLFEKMADTGLFKMAATTDKITAIHTRIIWTCSWTHDSKLFATGSREGRVVLWSEQPNKVPSPPLEKFGNIAPAMDFAGQSVTALAFAPKKVTTNQYLLAIGFDDGTINISYIDDGDFRRSTAFHFSKSVAHHLTVRKLAFKPSEQGALQLASASTDQSVRIFEIVV